MGKIGNLTSYKILTPEQISQNLSHLINVHRSRPQAKFGKIHSRGTLAQIGEMPLSYNLFIYPRDALLARFCRRKMSVCPLSVRRTPVLCLNG